MNRLKSYQVKAIKIFLLRAFELKADYRLYEPAQAIKISSLRSGPVFIRAIAALYKAFGTATNPQKPFTNNISIPRASQLPCGVH